MNDNYKKDVLYEIALVDLINKPFINIRNSSIIPVTSNFLMEVSLGCRGTETQIIEHYEDFHRCASTTANYLNAGQISINDKVRFNITSYNEIMNLCGEKECSHYFKK